MNENEKAVEVVGQEQPLAIADGLLDFAAIQRAEMMVEGINKIKIISLKVTGPQDWSLQGGKPFLENIGCMKIAQLWGVNFKERQFNPEGGERISDGKGDYILFTCVGRAEFKGRFVEDIGTCSTRDDFFGRSKGGLKALEDVDLENIKKKAVTNLQGRLLKKILGLSYNLDDLKAAGINLEKVTKTDYKSADAQAAEAKTVTVKVSEVTMKDGGKWKKFTVKDVEGASYNTFSESHAKVAKEAKAADKAVTITYTVTEKYGNELKGIVIA
jgi:hypothetical protein